MKFYIETDRLILRDLLSTDAEGLFQLDSNALVHKYLGNMPITQLAQAEAVIAMVRQQYEDNGIGRWAALEKGSGNFIGWCGLKWVTSPDNNHNNFYDVGYRLMPEYWGRGYATEATKAALQYAFDVLHLDIVTASHHIENMASRKVLEKCGLKYKNDYISTFHDLPCSWLEITREEWEKQPFII